MEEAKYQKIYSDGLKACEKYPKNGCWNWTSRNLGQWCQRCSDLLDFENERKKREAGK